MKRNKQRKNLNVVIDRWYDGIQESLREKTRISYKGIIVRHIKPYFEELELNKINESTVKQFIEHLENKGLSSSTCGLILSVLKSFFNNAVSEGLIAINPASQIKIKKQMVKHVDAFNKNEQGKIEELAKSSSKYFGILLALHTGMRIGELLALEWSDLDTIENTLTINKTTYSVKDEESKWSQVTREPKTSKSNRTIPISSKIKKMLLEIKKHSQSQYVVGFNDTQMGVRNYQSRFEYMLKRLKVRKFSFHSLRHTFATRCIELGIDIKTVSELLGHSSTTITLERYVHSSLEQKKRAITKLSKGL